MSIEEECSLELYESLPKGQLAKVMNADSICDIEPSFMGFVRIYKNLSEIIPKHFTIIDLGCAYAPQCFYFKEHHRYIGVDMCDAPRFSMANTTHFSMSIEDFISSEVSMVSGPTFAICSYVPPWGGDNRSMVRGAFDSVFVYYPQAPRHPAT